MGTPRKEIQDMRQVKWDDDLFIYHAENHPEKLTIYVPVETFIEFRERLNALGYERVQVVSSPELADDQLFATLPTPAQAPESRENA